MPRRAKISRLRRDGREQTKTNSLYRRMSVGLPTTSGVFSDEDNDQGVEISATRHPCVGAEIDLLDKAAREDGIS